MSRASIIFYFDVISPYSWIAFESFLQYEKVLPAKLQVKPFFLAGLMHAADNKSPAYIPNKRIYSLKDLERLSRYWGVRVELPKDFVEVFMKRQSLLAQRFLTALSQEQPEYLIPAAREFWTRIFNRAEPIHEIQHVREVCAKLKIPNSNNLMAKMESRQVKDLLKKNTEDALAAGAFGAPWIILKRDGHKDSCFFGGDRLPIICHELNIEFKGPILTSKI